MGRQTDAQRQTYIHNFARTLMGQLGITAATYEPCLEATNIHDTIDAKCRARIAYALIKAGFTMEIHHVLEAQSDNVIGRLAMAAPGFLPNNGGLIGTMTIESILNFAYTQSSFEFAGRITVFRIAFGGIIAAMADNIYLDLRKSK
ncbi:MAG: hypothetical protein JWN49_100 [Parcubacteria group bacterium]|nr:hypothetical protein [Parcubacteria group bacterium]